MPRLLALLLSLSIAPLYSAHAEDAADPNTEWALLLRHADAGDQEMAAKQLKRAGAKAVPALKAALATAEDAGAKARLNAMLELFDGAGEPDQGLAVKLTVTKTVMFPGEKVMFKALLLNQSQKPLVVYLGNFTEAPDAKSPPGANGVTCLMSMVEVIEGVEKPVKFASIDGRNYPNGMKYFVFAEIPALGSLEQSFYAVVSDKPTKTHHPEPDRVGIGRFIELKPDPCISLVGDAPHKLRMVLKRPEGGAADKEADDSGQRTFQGVKESFKSKAEYWNGQAHSGNVEITVKPLPK